VVQDLLKELEEFAFRGIPDMRNCLSKDPVAREEIMVEMVCISGAFCLFFQENVTIDSYYSLVTVADSSNDRIAGKW